MFVFMDIEILTLLYFSKPKYDIKISMMTMRFMMMMMTMTMMMIRVMIMMILIRVMMKMEGNHNRRPGAQLTSHVKDRRAQF